MAKGIYVGVGDKARKAKGLFVGVDNIARKVKKAYIGVGGVARLIFSGGGVSYYGTATSLSSARYAAASASIGNYFIIAGGRGYSTTSMTNEVETYDTSLTKSAPSQNLGFYPYNHAGCSNGSYAIFAGGRTEGDSVYKVARAYNSSLTRYSPSNLSEDRYRLAAARVGDSALFAGGCNSDDSATYTWDSYDSSLTLTSSSNISNRLSSYSEYPTGASVGNYALFALGRLSSSARAVNAFDASLTRSIISNGMLSGRRYVASASSDRYAVFAGGEEGINWSSDNMRDTIEAFDASLTVNTSATLSVAKAQVAGATLGKCVIFAGGGTTADDKTVDMYDESLSRTALQDLSAARSNISAGCVGNYAIFAGGDLSKVVDVYRLEQ